MNPAEVATIIAAGAAVYFALDLGRTIHRQRNRIHELRQALFDLYHTPEVPQAAREQALNAIKKGGAQ